MPTPLFPRFRGSSGVSPLAKGLWFRLDYHWLHLNFFIPFGVIVWIKGHSFHQLCCFFFFSFFFSGTPGAFFTIEARFHYLYLALSCGYLFFSPFIFFPPRLIFHRRYFSPEPTTFFFLFLVFPSLIVFLVNIFCGFFFSMRLVLIPPRMS